MILNPATGGRELPALDNPGAAGDLLAGKQMIDGGGEILTGTMPQRSADSLTASGAAVVVPAGYYPSNVSKSVAAATQATPGITVSSSGLITASATQAAGYVAAGTKSATKQLTTQAAKTVTPTTSQQTAVASGRYTTGAVAVAGDANLKAENIKSGVSIFGVAGSYGGASGGTSAVSSAVTVSKGLKIEAVVYYPASESELSLLEGSMSFTSFGAFHLYAHVTNELIVDSTAINITVSGGVYKNVGTNRWLILPTSSNVYVSLSTGSGGSIM